MFKQLLFTILPAAIIIFFMYIVLYPSIWLTKLKRRGKRSPLTQDLLRVPGETLRRQIEDINIDIDYYLLSSIVMPMAVYTCFLNQLQFTHINNRAFLASVYGVFVLGFVVYVVAKLTRALNRRNLLRLGMDAEQAVGQELNQLMLEGCRVFHDFQADGFNIDHIVIGPNGVFAIETKGRAKPDRGRGQENVRVVFDGKSLQFPTWNETEPLEQAKRQAVWLSKWITQSTGDQVVVKPALALPGWFVDRKGKDMLVYSGKNPQFLAKLTTETPLSPEMIQRITFQIDLKCRDVAPLAYKK